ncbi:hypothetical protein GJV44_p00005 (plasmid) [Candidatus Vallotia cooleyia]|nr:hypothetical protein GJV44_p00005 [Candidatus Vallotia cooleyia]
MQHRRFLIHTILVYIDIIKNIYLCAASVKYPLNLASVMLTLGSVRGSIHDRPPNPPPIHCLSGLPYYVQQETFDGCRYKISI